MPSIRNDRSWREYVIYLSLSEICGLFSFNFFLNYAHESAETQTSLVLFLVAALSGFAYYLFVKAYGRKQSYLAEQTMKREKDLMSAVLHSHPAKLHALIERHLNAQKLNDAKSGIVPSSNPADLIASRITGHTFSRVEFECDYATAKWLVLLATFAAVIPFLAIGFLYFNPCGTLLGFGFTLVKTIGDLKTPIVKILTVSAMVLPYALSWGALLLIKRRITAKRIGGDEIALKLDQENATAREFLHGWDDIRHSNAFAFAKRKIATSFSATRGIRLALSEAYAISSGAKYLITGVISLTAFLFVWLSAIDFSVVVAFATLNGWFTKKLADYFDLKIRQKKQNYANGLLVDLSNLAPLAGERQVPAGNRNDVEFHDVTISTPDGGTILRNANLEIKRGERVGIVGLTGSGKTTILKTLLGDIPPASGEVLLKGIPASAVSCRQLSEWVGVLPQRQAIFNATVRENILLRTCDDPKERLHLDKGLKDILRNTALDHDLADRIDGNTDPLDVQLSAQGMNLSVGEMAKIAMARLLVQDRDILIFDEYDSSLDEASKNILANLIKKIPDGKTVLLVSHHPTDLKELRLSRILVLDGDKVVSGTYDELLAQPGLFSRLHAFETGIYTDASQASNLTFSKGLTGTHQALQCAHVFNHLNWAQIDILAKRAEIVALHAGSNVITRGDSGDTMFSIISGEVEINGLPFGPGKSFGEIALFAKDAKRTATVRCKTDCTFAKLSRAAVMELCEKEPSATIEILKATATIAARESDKARDNARKLAQTNVK